MRPTCTWTTGGSAAGGDAGLRSRGDGSGRPGRSRATAVRARTAGGIGSGAAVTDERAVAAVATVVPG